jgi:hypothetical protein
MDNDRFDPVLIVCKAANLSWPRGESGDHAALGRERNVGVRT